MHLRTPRAAAYLAHRARRPRSGPGVRRGRPRRRGRATRATPTTCSSTWRGCASAGRRPRRRSRLARTLGVKGLTPPPPPPQEPCRAGGASPRGASLDAARRRRDQPPLRRLEPLLRAGARAVDDLHVRLLPDTPARPSSRHRRRSTASSLDKLRPAAGRPAARHRLRLGRHGPARRAARHPGHRVSRCRCSRPRGPRRPSPRKDWATWPRCGTATTATVRETGFDAVSLDRADRARRRAQLPRLLPWIATSCAPAGRLLNHCITRPHNRRQETGQFIDRYVFPDGELTGSGRIITDAQDAGLEVLHEENLREHYALTLARVVPQPRRALGRVRRRGRRGHGPGVGAVHGGLAARVRAQRDPAAPGAGAAPRPGRVDRDAAAPVVVGLTASAARRAARRPRRRPSQTSAVSSSASSSLLGPPAAPPAASQASAVARTMPTSATPHRRGGARHGTAGGPRARLPTSSGHVVGDPVGHPRRDVALGAFAGRQRSGR